jgi:hypothetical protein
MASSLSEFVQLLSDNEDTCIVVSNLPEGTTKDEIIQKIQEAGHQPRTVYTSKHMKNGAFADFQTALGGH